MRVNILGCPVDGITLEEAVRRCEAFIAGGSPHQLAVVNAAKLVKMDDDPELAAIVRAADLVLADGMSVVWAARLLGRGLPERVTGIDLMDRLVGRAAELGYRVFFLGAEAEVCRRVVSRYRARYPGLAVAGWRDGYFAQEEEAALCEQIRRARPDILLVAMGTPAKERWIHRHLHELGVPVCHGVGGSFDVVAGRVRRAPRLVQNAGGEWLWRLFQEPRRLWRRYLATNGRFAAKLVIALCAQVMARPGSGLEGPVSRRARVLW
jgi:N-acetylglucosaminyldiphosphoundecaprenol N-acetyl-beta-D-mannosaminyltransferase